MTGSTIQFQFPWGPETIETVLNRGDKQLKELEQSNGISYQVSKSFIKNFAVRSKSILFAIEYKQT